MDSYRLIINNYDLSTSDIEQETSVVGFTVVKAPKGPITPVRISSGDTSRIQDIFGVTSKDYPELYEAYSFNNTYDLYISAPYIEATVPAAAVTSQGVFPIKEQMNYSDEVENFVNNEISEDDLNLTFRDEKDSKLTLLKDLTQPQCTLGIKPTDSPSFNYSSDALIFDTGLSYSELQNYKTLLLRGIGNEWEITTDSEKKLYADNILVGSIVVTSDQNSSPSNSDICSFRFTGELSSTLKPSDIKLYDSTENMNKLEIFLEEKISKADIKAYLFPKYPGASNLHISFTEFNSNKGYSGKNASTRNILKMSVYEDEAFHSKSHSISINGSLDRSATDSSGSYIGFTSSNTSYDDQDLLTVYVNDVFIDSEISNFSDIPGYASIVLKGGFRSVESDSSGTPIYDRGWEIAQGEEYSEVNVFFDSRRHNITAPLSTDLFFGLKEYHPLSGYIFNYTPDPSNLAILDYGENYWNICNEGIISLDSKDRIISPLTGIRAAMQCSIIENRYGGVAPMYLNSGTPSVGGQLSPSGLIKMKNKYSKGQLEDLDEHNFNPIIQDHTYGVMVVGQKTCRSGEVTDWSYIGHVCSFLEFQREVKEQVMIPQLGKPNNPRYRELRKEQVERLLSPRIESNNRIWAEAIVDTSTSAGVNDTQAQRARKFVINVKVKVDIYSEYVTLNFTNVAQDTTL